MARSNAAGRPRPRLPPSPFFLVIIFGVIAPKILERRLPEFISCTAYWSASSRYQPRARLFHPMTTTWHHLLDTPERPPLTVRAVPQPNPGQYGKDSRIVSWIRSPTLRRLKETGSTNLRRGPAGGDGK